LAIFNSIQKTIFVPIHPAGYPFILISFAATALLIVFVGQIIGFFGIIFSVWCIYFFRNPVRYTPQRKSLVISLLMAVSYQLIKTTHQRALGWTVLIILKYPFL